MGVLGKLIPFMDQVPLERESTEKILWQFSRNINEMSYADDAETFKSFFKQNIQKNLVQIFNNFLAFFFI